MPTCQWDCIIHNALVFDGSGDAPLRQDIAIKDGRIAKREAHIDTGSSNDVIDAAGLWLMPGLLDIHTHYDLEVELDPRLPEAIRHGTTTVVIGNCSLGLAFGSQRTEQQDPIVDCFARVENIPKQVLRKCVDKVDWQGTAAYLQHLNSLPLGPNIVPLVPHSMLRIEVMGLEQSISRDPSSTELQEMERLLAEAMDQGYVGFSTDALPLHYLANDPHRNKCIPTQYASYKELKRLTEILRHRDRIWQTTPDPVSKLHTVRNFFLSSGRLHGKPLTVTAVAALDLVSNRLAANGLLRLMTLLNSSFWKGDFRLQALSAPFVVFGDGVTTPLLEELPSTSLLNSLEFEDRSGRLALLNDATFIHQFRNDWLRGKHGFDTDRLTRLLEIEAHTFKRDIDAMIIDSCPLSLWEGKSLGEVFKRQQDYQSENATQISDAEATVFARMSAIRDEADFVLAILREFDKDLRWHVINANDRPDLLRKMLFHPYTLPGFNDSGAHLTNMAYFDGNLRTLQIAFENGDLQLVANAVKRLTRDPARMFKLDTGHIEIGAKADITLIDPQQLATYDSEKNRQKIYRDIFQHEQLVNRSTGVVHSVLVGGEYLFKCGEFTDTLGSKPAGQALLWVSSDKRPA